MGIICESCGRDIDAIGQDNMGVAAPLCEDCRNEEQGHTVESLRREVRNLRFENCRLREKLDAMAEETAAPKVGQMRNTAVRNLREAIGAAYKMSRERALALTKLDECEMWMARCEPRKTAAPAAAGAAQDAAMPCLKADEARGVKLPDISVEVDADRVAEAAAKSLRKAMKPFMRMAVE
ncbi:hypothetical protein [Senegalimassilia anaerobia]|uniref:hypothetical protein n=1 Tax=Senegalimassilia anaerobia TaxID=1473216 RepID=UPI003A8FFF86